MKEQFQIEKEVVIGMVRTEERLNLDALPYNLIRLHNITQEIKKLQRRSRKLLRTRISNTPIKTRRNHILKQKQKNTSKTNFGGHP